MYNKTLKTKKCFKKGWKKFGEMIKRPYLEDMDEARKQLEGILGVTSEVSLYKYMNGNTPMTNEQIRSIEGWFKRRGIEEIFD